MNTSVKNTILTLLLSFFVITAIYSQSIGLERAYYTAKEFISQADKKQHKENSVNYNDSYLISDNNEPLAFVFNLSPHGFIIISAFEYSNPVMGFSLIDNLPPENEISGNPVFSVIKNISNSRIEVLKTNMTEVLKNSMDDIIYGPYVYTLWGQVNCHNNSGQLINVTNYYTPNHYAAGCVAISLSTLLHYYKWPVVGEGYHEYYDGLGSSTGWYSADFGNTYYKWSLMKNKYNNQASTDPEREAAGELAFHAAVSLDMNFEYNGSTSNVNKIPSTGSNYFRFYSFYKQESSSVFWQRLDKNIIEANPVILAVENNSGGGHSVVCDGLWIKNDGSRWYHLNMGWWGSGNGWFTIQDGFNAGGYTTILGGVLDFIPVAYLHNAQMHIDTNMFTLNWQYSHTIDVDAFEVQQNINSGGWETITDDYQDTSLLIVVNNPADIHSYRVRAKVNDYWYPSTWSNVVQLDILTNNEEFKAVPDHVVVYPSPFSDYLKVKSFGSSKPELVNVFDLTGNLIFSSETSDDVKEINTSDWGKGIYFIEITYQNKKITRKVIKN